jgi:hypothetical protein
MREVNRRSTNQYIICLQYFDIKRAGLLTGLQNNPAQGDAPFTATDGWRHGQACD